jgi:type II secretory pathway pseudopilin PulG
MVRSRRQGATLVEVLVYTVIMVLVFAAILGIFVAGRRYFEIARASVDVQQAANVAANKVARELMESTVQGIEFFPNSNFTSEPVGVVLLSARNAQGQFQYDSNLGIPVWQKYVGYYLADDQENTASGTRSQALFRAEYALSSPTTTPAKGSTQSPQVTPSFLASSGTNRRKVANWVVAPNASVSAPDGTVLVSAGSHGGFDVYSLVNGAKTYDEAANPIFLELQMLSTRAGVAQASRRTANVNAVTSKIKIEVRG